MAAKSVPKFLSAGLLLFRRAGGDIQVLLGHPGGPYWKRKDEGAWSIPKGLIAASENPLSGARREFAEEIGHDPAGDPIELGDARQPGGKIVRVWAIESDWDTGELKSNLFEVEWPPRSGRLRLFPEIDRAEWFSVSDALLKIVKGQVVFITRLLEALDHAND